MGSWRAAMATSRAGRSHGESAVLACSEPGGRTGCEHEGKACARMRLPNGLTGLGGGGRRQAGRPTSATFDLSAHILAAPRHLHLVLSPTTSDCSAPSTPRPSPFPIPCR